MSSGSRPAWCASCWAGGPGLAGFTAGEFTDHYVKLLFPPDGVVYPEPFDLAAIRAGLPRDQWPRTRTYTVRRWDAGRSELTIDVVHRAIPRHRLSTSGYWRTGHDEDGWQAGKREWNRQVEEDLEALRSRAPVTP